MKTIVPWIFIAAMLPFVISAIKITWRAHQRGKVARALLDRWTIYLRRLEKTPDWEPEHARLQKECRMLKEQIQGMIDELNGKK